jgi:uncharacterized protein (DUF1800 family)
LNRLRSFLLGKDLTMSLRTNSWDAANLWAHYESEARSPWNLRRVVHLHRRAGFAVTWGELQRDLKDGPGPSIDRLLAGKCSTRIQSAEFARTTDALGDQAADQSDPARLKAWWIYRMLWTNDPLGERLTLLWHNHFATSNDKVNDVASMRRQNEIFRRLGRGPFGELLNAVVHDPAMLIWLDAPANRQGVPNENLGRELMELFTLGIGHYSEADIKEAARALTGWKVARGAFREFLPEHDDGEKTVLGRTGRWKGDDLVRILLEHPATSRRLAWRVCEWLMGEGSASAAALDSLAAGLREHNLDMGWAIETVLRSRTFFAEANLAKAVLSPVEFIVGAIRALECLDAPPRSLLLMEACARMGQDLFYPPNVGGWAGGRAWLTTQGIVGRANFAAALVEGQLAGQPSALDGVALAQRYGRGRDLDDLLAFYGELLTGAAPDSSWHQRLRTALGPRPAVDQKTARAVAALVLASPEAQLA